MSANKKNIKSSEVNALFLTQQDMVSYRDIETGTLKEARKDDNANVITENLVGIVKATVEGAIALIDGTVQVNLVVNQPLKRVAIVRQLPDGALGFLSVIITVPGGDGVEAEITINSSSDTDISTIGFIGYEEQL